MNTCIIFCAAAFDRLAEPILPGDYLLAADGGLVHCEKLGIVPHGILGDFDSLGYIPENSTVFPVEKDDTDTMLAVRQGLKQGYRRFVLYGSLDGPRLDHTVANFQVLQYLSSHGAAGYLVGLHDIVTVIQQEKLIFSPRAKGILSVFSMGQNARGVNIQNLQYPLENGSLSCGFPLGVSNHFIGKSGQISVQAGSLLVIWNRNNGIPQRHPL